MEGRGGMGSLEVVVLDKELWRVLETPISTSSTFHTPHILPIHLLLSIPLHPILPPTLLELQSTFQEFYGGAGTGMGSRRVEVEGGKGGLRRRRGWGQYVDSHTLSPHTPYTYSFDYSRGYSLPSIPLPSIPLPSIPLPSIPSTIKSQRWLPHTLHTSLTLPKPSTLTAQTRKLSWQYGMGTLTLSPLLNGSKVGLTVTVNDLSGIVLLYLTDRGVRVWVDVGEIEKGVGVGMEILLPALDILLSHEPRLVDMRDATSSGTPHTGTEWCLSDAILDHVARYRG